MTIDRKLARPFHPFVATTLLFALCTPAAAADAADIDFARDIQPILNSHCVECHGGVKAAGDVSFVYEDRVIDFEADSGETVVTPGSPQTSEMVRRISSTDEDEVMPPPDAHPPLKKDEIKLITRWIAAGAKWSGHWAYSPPKRPPVPPTKFDQLANNDIDRFLFQRLQRESLQPSAGETPGRLLRRLSLALTGLPPNLKELHAFKTAFAADEDSAVENVVDELMARPAFGERWATLWLDLVRYADSGGLGLDQRRTIWAYRDWVVKSLNDDLPFDQFTIKQLAGDLLPNPQIDDLIATACQRNTQTNNEGGTDDEEFRVEAVVDRSNTTWQTWGAITFGCVQCHDHPYDPFRNTEYYQFMDFYNNSTDSDLPNDAPLLKVPNDHNKFAELKTLRDRSFELRTMIHNAGAKLRDTTTWAPTKELEVGSQNGTQYAVKQQDGHAEFFTVGTVPTKTQTQIRIPAASFDKQPTTAIKLTVMPHDPVAAVQNPEWGFVITDLQAWIVAKDETKTKVKFAASVADVPWLPTNPFRNVEANGKNWGADSRIHHTRQLVLIPETALRFPAGSRLDLFIKCDKTGHGSHPMVIQRGHIASSSDARWTQFAGKDSEANEWRSQLASNDKKRSQIPGSTVPVMSERPNDLARPTNIFQRGNRLEKGERVVAGLPSTLTKVASVKTTSPLTRLDMANWWVADSNPLTARVFVNRLWEQLFGVGIVPTLEDFGSSGDKPTHPQLLDHLAVRFQKDHRWSVKRMIREMVLTHAFRQAANVTPALIEKDPDNRLLARAPRLRLSAEFVRDQSLAFGGLLSNKIGGPPVRPPLPGGVWKPFDGSDKWQTAKPNTADRYRRSIYTYMKRSIPFPSFATFDAPSREFCTPRRLTSNTPLQALVMLNDPAFVECAEALGRRIKNQMTGSPRQRLATAHRLVTSRTATESRLDELEKLHREISKQEEDADKTWTVVAQVLLNLDEALTY